MTELQTKESKPHHPPTASSEKASEDLIPAALWGIGSMTGLGALAILIPHLMTGTAGIGASSVVGGLLLVAAGTTWRLFRKMRRPSENKHEFLLREAFHSVLTPQLITDEKGALIMANRAFRGWIDLGSQNAEAALVARFSATPEGSKEFGQIRTSLQKKHAGIAELPIVRGGKIIEWRRIVARPLEGSSNLYLWRFDDISERRRMEKAMQGEQAKLVDFMANVPVGIYSVDQHGRFCFVNKTLAEWLQVTPEELVKGDIRLHDVLRDPPQDIAAHAFTSGPQGETIGEAVMRRRDGSLFPVAITQTVIMDENGKTLRTRSVVRDQSPEREWQQALSVSEHRFQRLFAEAPIGILLVDEKYMVMECNYAFHSIIRRTHGSVVGSPLAELIDENDRKEMMAKLAEVLGGTDQVKPLEVKMAGEKEVIAQVFVKRFGLVSKEALGGTEQSGLMLYFIDATEQKHLQIQFTQSQKMQAIGQLAGGVAHDFNNLLTAMIGFCDLLLQRHKPGDQSFNDIMQIKQNGNRAANLVRQLLAFSRQQTLQPKVLNLADVLSELTNLLRRLIGAQIKLEMIHGRDVGLVKVDQGQLEQVIINLVVNARDAMPNGGTLTIRTRNHRQEMHILRGQDDMPPGNYVSIEVSDLGVGIPEENLQRIFDPFFSTKEIGSGTGLGLSTVYGIVRQTEGFIGVESTVGVGTTITVYLPVYERSAGEEDTKPDDVHEDRPGPDLTGAGTILLVEDEDAVRVFSSRALRNKGYQVFEARSGEEAIDVLETENGDKIDLIVSDVVMPQMDGPTMYKIIRERWPNIKVIFVSGYTEDRLREQFTSGEMIYFLSKPFTLKQLASKVKDVMEENK
ncbi:MAG: response regulator [Alphaproteobacteria bacterium]|nr:response regulator [Alphaproteobacteria bacterium]